MRLGAVDHRSTQSLSWMNHVTSDKAFHFSGVSESWQEIEVILKWVSEKHLINGLFPGLWVTTEDDEALRGEPRQEAIPTSLPDKAKQGTESLEPGECWAGWRSHRLRAAAQGTSHHQTAGLKQSQWGRGGGHAPWPLFPPVLWVLHTQPNPAGSQRGKEPTGCIPQRSPPGAQSWTVQAGDQGGGEQIITRRGPVQSNVKWLLDYLISQGLSTCISYNSWILIYWITILYSIQMMNVQQLNDPNL